MSDHYECKYLYVWDVFIMFFFVPRSEPWNYMCQGEQGKQHAWEPVGHSTLTDWKKYSGIVQLKLLLLIL